MPTVYAGETPDRQRLQVGGGTTRTAMSRIDVEIVARGDRETERLIDRLDPPRNSPPSMERSGSTRLRRRQNNKSPVQIRNPVPGPDFDPSVKESPRATLSVVSFVQDAGASAAASSAPERKEEPFHGDPRRSRRDQDQHATSK